MVLNIAAAHAQVRYEGPRGCPSEAEVAARVNAPSDVAVQLTLRESADGFEGAVSVTRGAGAATAQPIRKLSSAVCTEVVDALVLVANLELERLATGNPPKLAATPPAVAAPRPPPLPALQASGYWAFGADVGAAASYGLSPSVAAEFGVTLSAQRMAAARSQMGGWMLRLAVRVGLPNSIPGEQVGIGAQASISHYRTSAQLCPLQWRTGGLGFAPCLAQEFGLHRGASSGFIGAQTDARLWTATGIATELTWRPARTLGLVFALEASVLAPWARVRYQLGTRDVYETAALYASGGIAIGWRAP